MVYVAMGLLGLASTGVILFHRRDAALLATFFVSGAALILADWVAHGCFLLYLNHPGLVQDVVIDSIIGKILSESLFVPSLCVLSVVAAPGWKGIALSTLVVTLIEIVFLRVGLLSHHGWSVWYSLAGFPIYFGAVHGFWFLAHRQGVRSRWVKLVARAGVAGLLSAYLAASLKITRAVTTHIQVLADPSGNQSLGLLITYLLLLTPMTYWVLTGDRKQRQARLAISPILWLMLNWALVTIGFRTYNPPWNPLFDGIATGIVAYVACLIDEWMARWASERARV